MRFGVIDFPEDLIAAIRGGDLVVFAGAGTSMGEPACLPNFRELTRLVASGTGLQGEEGEQDDRFLGRLKHRGVDVHTRVAEQLSRKDLSPTQLHRSILRMFGSLERARIVTTNFDVLFERAAIDVWGAAPQVFSAPALPLGERFSGIVHVHGSILRSNEMVLTDADFGRAYLTAGWARRFLVALFRTSPILFVGYSHDDVVVSYLARALPESAVGRRFALVPQDADPQRWALLGIEAITYEFDTPGNHSHLSTGVERLANSVQRSVLDWQREVTAIAEQFPPIDEEVSSVVDHALGDTATARFFSEAAKLTEWIGWLDKRGHLDPLFSERDLAGPHAVLAQWLADKFADEAPSHLFQLIAKHGMAVSPQFWHALGRHVGLSERPIEVATLGRWVSLLVATMPRHVGGHILLWLGERCIRSSDTRSMLRVFDSLAGCRLLLRPGMAWPGDGSQVRVDPELMFLGDHYSLNELWQKGLKPNLSAVVESLLAQVVTALEHHHEELGCWERADSEWDSGSWGRAAIEPHEQDQHPTAIDLLIDATRDAVEELGRANASAATQWSERLSRSRAQLLKRVAVHGVGLRRDLSPEEKIAWLLGKNLLHDSPCFHETHLLLAAAYPTAGEGTREQVIQAVLAQRLEGDEPEAERRTDAYHFQWLHWLSSSAPECELAAAALERIRARNPELTPREHPDLSHWTTSGRVGHRTPWTSEQLRARTAAAWLPELLRYRRQGRDDPDRDDLVNEVGVAASDDFGWGEGLAAELGRAGEWASDLWRGLFRAWSGMNLDEQRSQEVLSQLNQRALYRHHPEGIARVLTALLQEDRRSQNVRLTGVANAIASSLWDSLDRSAAESARGGWLQLAVNRPAGVLAQFWLASLSIWRSQQDPRPTVMGDEYRRALASMVADSSHHGRMARSVLASQLAFFLAIDPAWTTEHLLPLLSGSRGTEEFQAAWDGYLTWGQINPRVFEVLGPVYLDALTRLDGELQDNKKRFAEHVTAVVVLFVEDPLDRWIPEMFHHGGTDARHTFSFHLMHHLRAMNDSQVVELWTRWLKRYWINRLQGVPAALDKREVEVMFDWLLYLAPVFTEAADLATRLPRVPLEHSALLYSLGESPLPARYPSEVASLLVHLDSFEAPSYLWTRARAFIESALSGDISSDRRRALKEMVLRRNLN